MEPMPQEYTPSKKTQLKDFMEKNPTFDGRGTIIAIVDTGVDLSLNGLQITSTGLRKIVDCIDCTGANDVDTSTTREMDKNGFIEGVTGRKLKIPTSWVNPSNIYHVGMKPIMEFYGGKEAKDIQVKLKQELAVEQKKALEEVRTSSDRDSESSENEKQSQEKIWKLENEKQFQSFLGSSWQNHGPVSDCILWHNGKDWQACLDTSFCGDLEICKVMYSFRLFGEYDKFELHGHTTVYTFRISNDGNWLEIVIVNSAYGSHGTSMASIAAAYYPTQPWKNGCAPGAQLLSLRVLDSSRACLNKALTKALQYCVQYEVQVLNYSFGSKQEEPNAGPRSLEIENFVNKTNVLFISSAGNLGPSLNSSHVERRATGHILAVAPHMSGDATKTYYNLNQPQNDNISVFGSRGPCVDGSLGISFCAPSDSFRENAGADKAAIGAGASSACAYASGAISCIISGLLALKLSWTRYQIQLAIENTAKKIDSLEKLAQGNGMIQILDAFEYFKTNQSNISKHLEYFRLNLRGSQNAGLLIRNTFNSNDYESYTVDVTPVVKDSIDKSVHFEKHIHLTCKSTWVRIKDSELFLTGVECNFFNIEICTEYLQRNHVYYTEIIGFDARNFSIGAMFRFPISVILPDHPNQQAVYSYKLESTPTVPNRVFLSSPQHCNIIEVSLMPETILPEDNYSLTVVYLEDKVDARNTKKEVRIKLDKSVWRQTFQIKSGKVIEVCLTRYPSDVVQPVNINAKLSFYGVSMPDLLVMDHNSGSFPVTFVNSEYGQLEISPEIVFKSVRTPLSPILTKFYNYGENDVNMNGQVYQYLQLSYEFTIYQSSFFSIHIPGFYRYSNTTGISLQVFDRNKRYIDDATDGCYYISSGKYTLQLQIRDTNLEILKSLEKLPVCMDSALTKHITVLALKKRTMPKLAIGSEMYGNRTIGRGKEETVFFAGLDRKGQWIKNWFAPAGSYLMGNIKLARTEDGTPLFENAVKYYLSNNCFHSDSLPDDRNKKNNEPNVSLEDCLKREEFQYLRGLDCERWANLFGKLELKYPNSIELMIINMEFIYNKKELSNQELQYFMDLSKKIMKLLEMATEETSKRSLVLKMKAFLFVDYMLAKKKSFVPIICMPRRTFSNIHNLHNLHNENYDSITFTDVDEAYNQYKVEELNTPEENWLLGCKHAALHNHWGRALGFLAEWGAFIHKEQENSMKEQDIAIAQIFEHHGWIKLAGIFRSIEMVENREKFRPFQGNLIPK